MKKQIKPLSKEAKFLIERLRKLNIFEMHALTGLSPQVICRMYGGIHHTKVFWACIDTIQEMPFGGDFSNIDVHKRIKIREWLAKEKAPIIRKLIELSPNE